MKIYKKITLAFITTSLIAIALISITSYQITKASLATQAIKHLESIASSQHKQLEMLFDHNLEKLNLISSRTQLRLSLKDYIGDPQTRHQDRMNRILRDAKSSIMDFKDISVLTLDGKVAASTDLSTIGAIHTDEEYFIRGRDGSVSDIFYLDDDNNLMIHLAEPLILQNEILGVITVTTTAQNITSMVTDYSELGKTGYTLFVKKIHHGEQFIRSPDRSNDTSTQYTLIDFDQLGQVSKKALTEETSSSGVLIDSRGESVLAVTQYCKKCDIGLSVRINSDEAFAPINRLRDITILVILFSLLTIVIVSIPIAKSITAPIVSLTNVAGRISKGDLTLKAEAVSKDETGRLALSFNRMVEHLNREITDRKQAEEMLRASEQWYRLIYNNAPLGIMHFDSNGIIRDINDKYAQLMGAPREKIIGFNLLERLHDQAVLKAVKDTLAGQPGYYEGEYTSITGQKKSFLRAIFQTLTGDDGMFIGAVAILEDISERKRAEDEIRKLNAELEQRVADRTARLKEKTAELEKANLHLHELDHLKSMFIASMSHELRTPLNSIIGFTGIILQGLTGEINSEQQDQLERVYASAKHLLALINDVIDISKIEAGNVAVHAETFDLDGAIHEATSSLIPAINDKGLDLEISSPQGIQLRTDRKRFLQCILNFLSNAVKFTKKGKIGITAREIDGMVEVAVQDTGIG
ncbi:MAG TPA: histidine kinase dimerization/phospho-acceptor domain-containing protein, partial [Syntrophales bacterium]|nr:histidine kinase dimerization/phospho-acceptor domain-containing protein [Syntrophales bacterium]